MRMPCGGGGEDVIVMKRSYDPLDARVVWEGLKVEVSEKERKGVSVVTRDAC